MPAGHTPGPRQEAGSGGALGQGRVNGAGGVRQSLQGGRRPGRQGQHLLMPRRVTQGDTHRRPTGREAAGDSYLLLGFSLLY